MEDSYCRICGTKRVVAFIDYYSERTGEPINAMICPSGKCEHSGHFWRDKFQKWFQKNNVKCKVCNKETYLDSGDF